MEPEGSLPYSQQHTSGPYPEHMHPVHTFPLYFPKMHSNNILPSTPKSISRNQTINNQQA
jgi:hypothetical protein